MKKNKIILPLITTLLFSSLIGCSSPSQEPNHNENPAIDVPAVDDVDREAANDVIELIATLNDNSTTEEILSVYEKYSDLTQRQKSFVTNYAILEAQLARVEKMEAVNRVNALIDALDPSNISADAVREANKAYSDLLTLYGEEWQNKISAERVAKLHECTVLVCENDVGVLLDNAAALDISKDEKAVQFTLLASRIDFLLAIYPLDIVSELDNYDKYMVAKEELGDVYSIAADDYYSSTHNIDKFLQPLDVVEDDQFGYFSVEDFTGYNLSGAGNIQVATQHDFSMYKKIAFFTSYPLDNMEIQFINNEKTIYRSEPVAKNTLKYVEIDLSSFIDPTGITHCHIGAYLLNRLEGCISGFKYSAIVGIKVNDKKAQATVDSLIALINSLDVNNPDEAKVEEAREIYNSLPSEFSQEWQDKVPSDVVAKLEQCEIAVAAKAIIVLIDSALTIQLTNNQNITRFRLLADAIDTKYNMLNDAQKAGVTNYPEYAAKKAGCSAKMAYNAGYTTDDGGSWPALTRRDSETYGVINTHSFASRRTSPFNLFMEGLNGKTFASIKTISFFIQFTEANTELCWFIGDGAWTKTSYKHYVLVDASKHLYYAELDVTNMTHYFNGFNPYFCIYLSGGTNSVMVTDVVALN